MSSSYSWCLAPRPTPSSAGGRGMAMSLSHLLDRLSQFQIFFLFNTGYYLTRYVNMADFVCMSCHTSSCTCKQPGQTVGLTIWGAEWPPHASGQRMGGSGACVARASTAPGRVPDLAWGRLGAGICGWSFGLSWAEKHSHGCPAEQVGVQPSRRVFHISRLQRGAREVR